MSKNEYKSLVDNLTFLMQYHGNKNDLDQSGESKKSIDKSYVRSNNKNYLSSHVARWQLIGVIKEMQEMGLEVDQASRMAAEVGLKNGVYNVMIYDTMVCRRGILRKRAFENLLDKHINQAKVDSDEKEELRNIKHFLLCFFPVQGIQIDYTAGFHVSSEAIPEEALQWMKRDGEWPCERLKEEVLEAGALLVPKTFKNDKKEEKAKRWRINFDLNLMIRDQSYSPNIDTRRTLIILKDMKNLFMKSDLVKSYYLKLAISWTMFEHQNKRNEMTSKDFLCHILEYLQKAFATMKLPDFFNERFNHLHRNKDRRYEASGVADRIKDVLGNLEKSMNEMEASQQKFNNKIFEDIMKTNKVDLHFKRGDKTRNIDLIHNHLPILSKTDLERVFDDYFSMFEVEYCTMEDMLMKAMKMKSNKKTMKKKGASWQSKLKEKYKIVFQENISFSSDDIRRYAKDRLSESILKYAIQNREGREETLRKFEIWDQLEKLLEKSDIKCEVVGFGSSFNGFGLKGCDLDLQIFPDDEEREKCPTKKEFLKKIKDILLRNDFILENARVVGAKFPILRAVHRQFNIEMDIGFGTGVSTTNIRDAHFLFHCAHQDPRVAPLMLTVKKWARSHNINNAYKHTFSSHALALMMVHYLTVQTTPSILPNYFKTFPSIFNLDQSLGRLQFNRVNQIRTLLQHHTCQASLGDLFLGFLKFYSELDMEKNCITVNELVDRNDDRLEYTLKLSWQYQPIIIQEIFNRRNAAFSINWKSQLKRIMQVFSQSYNLAKSNSNITFQDMCQSVGAFDVSELQNSLFQLD